MNYIGGQNLLYEIINGYGQSVTVACFTPLIRRVEVYSAQTGNYWIYMGHYLLPRPTWLKNNLKSGCDPRLSYGIIHERLNPDWVPPEFPDGADTLLLEPGYGPEYDNSGGCVQPLFTGVCR
jgi:hypothetical protein